MVPTTAPTRATAPPPEQVTALQQVREYPAISILLTTTPAGTMTHSDGLRLDALVDQATRRVRDELQPAAADPALRRLSALVAEARRDWTGAALALYASASTEAAIRLPITVRDRAVVDPSFATRDLVRALHRTRRHLVLVLDGGQARLFDAAAETLLPALTSAFPRYAEPPRSRRGRGRADRLGDDPRASRQSEFYRQVDAALGAYLRLHPAPLVLVGDERATAAFRRISTNCARLAGTVRGNLTGAPSATLLAKIRGTLDEYLHRRQDEALELLARRRGSARVASGIGDVWCAARTGAPEMLVVDEAFYYPARLGDDGNTLTPAADADDPDVLDDAVDELIEAVLTRGGWIAFTDPGRLDEHGGVALALRG
jgi:hypothetical protein